MGLQAGGNSSVLTIDIGTPTPVQNILAQQQSVRIPGPTVSGLGSYLFYSADGSVSIIVSSVFKNYWIRSQQQMIGGGIR